MFIIFREWMDAGGGKGRFPGSKDQGKAGGALPEDQTERSYHVGVNLVMAWLLARRSAVIAAGCALPELSTL
jgi:hypothetical protein